MVLLRQPSRARAIVRTDLVSGSQPTSESPGAANEKLECLLRDLHYGYVELDLRGRVVDANRRAEELSGYTLEEMRAQESFAFVFPPDEYARAAADLQKALGAPNAGPREYRMLARDGRLIDIESNYMDSEIDS